MPRIMSVVKNPRILAGAVIVILWALMMVATRHVYPPKGDMVLIVRSWWDYISVHGFSGVATIKTIGGDVTPIWYFIMYLFTALHLYPQLPLEFCMKSIAVVFDLVAAASAWLVLRRVSSKDSWRPLFAGALVLFLPSFFADVLKTNLPDSPYLAFCLLSLVALQRQKNWLAWFLIGIGAAFKMMAIYIIPFYLFFYLRDFRIATWKQRVAPLFIAAGFAVCSIPSLLAGQSVYEATFGWVLPRIDTHLDFGFWNILNGQEWQWFPPIDAGQMHNLVVFGYACILLVFFVVYLLLFNVGNREEQAVASLDLLVLSPLVCWFFLPSQRESYFTLAAVFVMIALIIRPDRGRFVVFIMINVILWEAYHGLNRVIGQLAYEYLLLGIAGYLVWRIWRISILRQTLRREVATVKLKASDVVDDENTLNELQAK